MAIVIGMTVVGFAAGWWAMKAANAAERIGRWEITLLYSGKDYDGVSRTFRTLGEPFDSKTACDVAITRVKILVSGARLRCDPIEQWRVN